MTESSEAPSVGSPQDVDPQDLDPRGDEGRLGDDAASDDLAHLQDGELIGDQVQSIETPDALGGVGGEDAGGAG